MTQVWLVAALWLLLALVAVLVAHWLRVSTALSEIMVGVLAQGFMGALIGGDALGAKAPWIAFLAGTGAIVLTFLAGAELDPVVFRAKWKESSAVGLAGFLGPFLGAAMVAHFILGWPWRPSWLAGVALSTTSVAVVYAVMLEFGFNRTTYGKTILAACFINDLGAVIALGLIFSPFTVKTLVFLGIGLVVLAAAPFVTRHTFAGRPDAHRSRVRPRRPRRRVLFPDDVHGADLWDHFGAIRTEPWNHRSDSILLPGRHGDRQCGDSHGHC